MSLLILHAVRPWRVCLAMLSAWRWEGERPLSPCLGTQTTASPHCLTSSLLASAPTRNSSCLLPPQRLPVITSMFSLFCNYTLPRRTEWPFLTEGEIRYFKQQFECIWKGKIKGRKASRNSSVRLALAVLRCSYALLQLFDNILSPSLELPRGRSNGTKSEMCSGLDWANLDGSQQGVEYKSY